MSLQEAFRVSPSVMPGSAEAQKMTVTSGRSCIDASIKSNPIGLFVKTLVESSRWWSKATLLKWRTRQIYSTRIIAFTDTNTEEPLPFNESAKTSKPMDMKSNRFLYQLVPLALPTEETESSSLDGGDQMYILPTPQVKMATGGAHKLDENGKRIQTTKNTPFSPQLNDLAASGMLPTPTARDEKNPSSPDGERIKRKRAQGWTIELNDLAPMGLLPTPTAIEGTKYTNTYNPESQMGQSLSALAGSGMLPTPIATDISHKRRVSELKETGAQTMASRANGANRPNGLSDFIDFYDVEETTPAESDGETSRLSPLFTEEMMGFPFLWTTLPFLQANGAQKR